MVTVIIPAFNAADTISATLRSACRQSHRNLEIMVIDDGSRDNTADHVERAMAADHRIRLIRQDNAGVAAARNTGLAEARGEFVAPLDADDLWHIDKVARQVRRWNQTSDAAMVYCWSVDIDDDDRVIERRLDAPRFEGDVSAALVVANFIDNSSVPLFRREALIDAGGWDEKLRACKAQGCEDWMLYLRIATAGKVLLEPAFLVGYRQTAQAMSRNVAAMNRSKALVLAEARRSQPHLPRRLWRWAGAAFDHYTADILEADGRGLRSLAWRTRAIVRDPAWLLSTTARRKIKGILGRKAQGTAERPRFDDVPPEPEFFYRPDRWTSRRRAALTRLQG